jgi:hypothetical protein
VTMAVIVAVLLIVAVMVLLYAQWTGEPGPGRHRLEPARLPVPAQRGECPYPPADDAAFDAAISAWLAGGDAPGRERLASTGELARLYERPYPVYPSGPPLSSTAELQALANTAYAGDMTALAALVEAWKKEIDNT